MHTFVAIDTVCVVFVLDAMFRAWHETILRMLCVVGWLCLTGSECVAVTVEPPSNDHPHQRPYFVWRTVFSVCAIPDRRPSLRRDQRPGQMGFSPSRTTTSPTVYFQESRLAVQHPFQMVDCYNVVPRHLSSNLIALNFLLFWRGHYNDVLKSTLHRYDVARPPALRHIRSRPNSSALN